MKYLQETSHVYFFVPSKASKYHMSFFSPSLVFADKTSHGSTQGKAKTILTRTYLMLYNKT